MSKAFHDVCNSLGGTVSFFAAVAVALLLLLLGLESETRPLLAYAHLLVTTTDRQTDRPKNNKATSPFTSQTAGDGNLRSSPCN